MTREIRAECPECGAEVDAASEIGPDEATPEPGDLAVCLYCAGLGIYVEREDGSLGIRLTTAEEKLGLSENEQVNGVRAAIIGQSVWFKE